MKTDEEKQEKESVAGVFCRSYAFKPLRSEDIQDEIGAIEKRRININISHSLPNTTSGHRRKSMQALKEKIIEQINRDTKYYQDLMKASKAKLKDKGTFLLADKLESSFIIAGECEVNVTTWGSIVMKFKNHEDARDFVEKVMNKLSLDKVDRNMEQYSFKPTWYYHINTNIGEKMFYLSVYPAQPVEDCIPVKEYEHREPRERWVCKPKYLAGGENG